jgi:transposase
MGKKRRQHGSAFKAKVALAAIKEEQTLSQITSHYGVHATQVRQWKKQAIEAIQDCFSKRRERNNADEAALQSTLYEQIGRQQTELNWLKKKCGLDE